MNDRPEVPEADKLALNTLLKEAGDTYRAGDYERSSELTLQAWNQIPEPKGGWDFFPEIIVRHMLTLSTARKDVPAAKHWLALLYNVFQDADRKKHITLTTEALALRDLGLAEESAAVTRRLQDLFGDTAFTGEAAALRDGGKVRTKPPDSSATELDDAVHRTIQDLSSKGDDLVEDDDLSGAREKYDAALALLPEPKDRWSAWTWLQSALGDTYFFEENWLACRDAFRRAVAGPDGLGNPFIHLRLGQCAFEMNDEPAAKDELMRAYMGGGAEIFDDDWKYLMFLKQHAKIY